MAPLFFHMTWQVLPFFLGNFKKSTLLSIFAKIFAKILFSNLRVTHRASHLPLRLVAVQMLNNDRCLGLHLLIHNVASFANTEAFFTLRTLHLSSRVPLLYHYYIRTGRIENEQGVVTSSPISWFVALRSFDCGHMAVDQPSILNLGRGSLKDLSLSVRPVVQFLKNYWAKGSGSSEVELRVCP